MEKQIPAEKWLEYRNQIKKNIEYLSSKKGKEQRKKDYKVVDFRTYYDITTAKFPWNSDVFGRVSYVYADFPDSSIVGIQIARHSRKGGDFHIIYKFMVLKSFYDEWKKEKGE